MTYMKNGGLIRLVDDRDVARFAGMGFAPMTPDGVKPARKSARKSKEEQPHGGA